MRVVRSLEGYNLTPSLSFEDRRAVEQVISAALADLGGVYKGNYYGLPGSESYSGTELGRDEEARLKEEGILLPEPASTIVLSSGIGRHWPDGRGIYYNDTRDVYVWVNNSDHMEISAKAQGDAVKETFGKLMGMVGDVEKTLQRQGSRGFAHDEHFGYLSTCPSNLGTGLRILLEMRLPNLMNRSEFRDILRVLGLRMFVTEPDSTVCCIENTQRAGRTEVELTNAFIESCRKLVTLESCLERGSNVEDEMKTMLANA
ncbi:creatine kinase, putative [Perkinsus marinus ATCC 50983]|uniref:Creatine kinase, putative n=1 Tax=Perkinsus marinus (strain ATCC 50983 / TXsc) TaxID=423536 RepID=C5L1F3_PERM5|nr:creatine kinase, putative [Perkinsus marinus ATCC 50983]EER09440.1 creatine kinase, putative [Perkinsus marinus ATCC 50983]|eukprot:XP_002777624.1 creatine kinase, putative [Perkinsus marinus ATCC 50983]